MHRACPISILAVIPLLACPAQGQGAVEPVDPARDGEYVIPDLLLDRTPLERFESSPTVTPITIDELSSLRAAGADPSWIAQRYDLPSFDPNLRRLTQGDDPLLVESWATHNTSGRGVELASALRFSVGRTTELRDGNISGSQGGIGGGGDDHVASYAQSEGEYDIYDLSLEWDAISAGPVTLSVLSGIKAIEANIGKRVSKAEGTVIESAHRVTAMPMVGSGIRWRINEALSFSGAAITHPIESGDALIDFNASTDLRISQNVGFVAGYRIIRSSFDVDSIETEVEQEGLFARLEIKF